VDAGTMRGLFTVVVMVAFIALVIWAYSRRRKAHFDEMAHMPLEEDRRTNKGANSDE
jgi:cytochrome c oxidase cbb3-type subunit 4